MSKRNILLNETGQMAVFIALIFQVLFVLFAMVINIGLIVHDKINLQNSVDLAAYYAASKQAESMNMIAHINYQMRQDYKLLAWRYRVLGSFGLNSPVHPGFTDPRSGSLPDVAFSNRPQDEPSVCIAHQGWNDSFGPDPTGNKCRTNELKIPDLKPIKMIPLAQAFNISVIDQFARARDLIGQSCDMISPFNWALSTIMIATYRLSIGERKQQIKNLALDLSRVGDFSDTHGESVRAGALKTFRKNLTASNNAPGSFDEKNEDSFEFINGLSLGGCEQPDPVGIPSWIVDIPISPIVRYTELTRTGSTSQCDATMKSYDIPPASNTAATLGNSFDQLVALAGEPPPTDIRRSSRGFEKNPWCLAYVAIKAKTKPRKPFAPFGAPIEMEAKAIAEPFGGRIGPWYGKRWPANARQSEGADSSQQTDPLAVPRGDFDSKYGQLYLPNYSRFPGDTLGLKSRLALGWMRDTLYSAMTSKSPGLKFNISDYANPTDVLKTGDPLAWNSKGSVAGTSRRLEIAAVAPDLFDITYYSVDPHYFRNYYSGAKEKMFGGIAPIADIGSRYEDRGLQEIGIEQQIRSAQEHVDFKDAYYMVKDWQNVLTGWIQGGAVEYTSRAPDVMKNFGACEKASVPDRPAIPGSCIAGGRVGYSVRLIHKNYLFAEHVLGGLGAGTSRIKNAPPEDF